MARPAKPSAHVTWRELACHDAERTPYPDAFVQSGRLDTLMRVFEGIRWHCGGAKITILSAYRTPTWNRIQGGSPRSRHCSGEALDLQTPRSMPLAEFYTRVLELANGPFRSVVGAVGYYDWGVHVDIRPRSEERLAQWDERTSLTTRGDNV